MGMFGDTDAESEGTWSGAIEGGGYGAGIGGQYRGPIGAGIGSAIGLVVGGFAGSETGRKHQEKLDQMHQSYRALQQLQQTMYNQRMADIDKSLSYFAPVEQRMGMQHKMFEAPGDGGLTGGSTHGPLISGDERYREMAHDNSDQGKVARSTGRAW